jgi:hypothetical protein
MAKSSDSTKIILNEMREAHLKLDRVRRKTEQVKSSLASFNEYFEAHGGRYVVFGLICLTVMVFDFIVNGRTMIWLSRMLHTQSWIIASILTLVDVFLAVQASGIFDVKDPVIMRRSKRKWQIILWSIAAIKMIAYVVFIVSRTTIISQSTGEVMETGFGKIIMMALPQLIFIVVIYSLLHICGSGIWYFIGRAWYGLRLSMIGEEQKVKTHLSKLQSELQEHCVKNGLDYEEIRKQYYKSYDQEAL